MPNATKLLEQLDRLDPPDLWSEASSRTPGAPPPPPPSRAGRVISGVVAGVAAAVALTLVIRAFSDVGQTRLPGSTHGNGKLAVVREGCTVFPCHAPGRLLLMNADGTDEREIAVGSMPAWSPDGSHLTFTTGGADAIRVVDQDGANLTTVVRCEEPDCVAVMEPTWSPDGGRMAYSAEREVDGQHEHDIWVVNADGTDSHPVTECRRPDCVSNFAPAWSPVDDRIAMWSMIWCGDAWGPSLRMLNLDNGNVTPVVPCGKWSEGARIAWSPDGQSLAFELNTPDHTANVFTEPASGGPRTQVSSCDGTDCRWALYPSWSPDGRWLLFAVKSQAEDTFDIARARPDGSELSRVGIEGNMTAWQPVLSR